MSRYFKAGELIEGALFVNESEVSVVRFLYNTSLIGISINIIAEQLKEKGFRRSANVAIQRILSYPLYAGLQHVDAFKDYPGGLFPAQHEPIVDLTTWEMVQRKLKNPEKERVVIDEKIPLRGILKGFCGKQLTGAPSRGKLGNYYYYYSSHTQAGKFTAIVLNKGLA